MNHKKALIVTFLFVCRAPAATAQALPKADHSEDVGFSSDRLARITSFFQSEVDGRALPGAVLLVARNGKVAYSQALGYQNREKGLAMKPDAIFRIFSMTKPLTSVAVMMLAEEGKIDLLAPVAKYLSEFKDAKVGVEKIDPKTKKPKLALHDPTRPMTVQDLLCHTSGIVLGYSNGTVVHQMYHNANLYQDDQPLSTFVNKLSKLPLAHQPGRVWEYGLSYYVLGRIVEVASGMTLDRFIEERITKPLRMPDTAFYLSVAQAARAAEPQVDPATGKHPDLGEIADLTQGKQKLLSGDEGLLTTAGDFARFCQMLLNGGELDSVRLLSPKTVAVMTADQIASGTSYVDISGLQELAPIPELGQSYGLGFAIRTAVGHSPISGSLGDFFWAGYGGTYFWVDPKEKLFAVMMIQMDFDESARYRRALRELVYGALIH